MTTEGHGCTFWYKSVGWHLSFGPWNSLHSDVATMSNEACNEDSWLPNLQCRHDIKNLRKKSPITETYLFGPKTYLIWKGGKAKRLKFLSYLGQFLQSWAPIVIDTLPAITSCKLHTALITQSSPKQWSHSLWLRSKIVLVQGRVELEECSIQRSCEPSCLLFLVRVGTIVIAYATWTTQAVVTVVLESPLGNLNADDDGDHSRIPSYYDTHVLQVRITEINNNRIKCLSNI